MKVIAVDDERNALENLEQVLLEVAEVDEVELFDTGDAALTYLADKSADVALLDIEMRGMGGLELAKRIREKRPETGVIFLTGYSQYALDAFELHANGYVLKPARPDRIRAELLNLRKNSVRKVESDTTDAESESSWAGEDSEKLLVKCFGNFEAFCHGKPLNFRYSKSKELLAYLVDRRGAAVPSDELIAVLWEDKPVSNSLRSQLRNSMSDLKNTLKEAGADEMLVKVQRSYYVDTTWFTCDYYQFLKGDLAAVNAYQSEYMTQYSWAEMTLGGLAQD